MKFATPEIEKQIETQRQQPLGKYTLKSIDDNLLADEIIYFIKSANINIIPVGQNPNVDPLNFKNKLAGMFVITDKRVFFSGSPIKAGVIARLAGLKNQIEQIILDSINNVESKSGFVFSTLRIQSITNIIEVDLLVPEAALVSKMILELVQKAKNPAPAAAQEPKTQPRESAFTKIEKLKDLHTKGILTEEEFNQKKSELLKQI